MICFVEQIYSHSSCRLNVQKYGILLSNSVPKPDFIFNRRCNSCFCRHSFSLHVDKTSI